MPSSFDIAPADPAARWSIIDGTPPSYDLIVTSNSDKPVLCSLSVDEPVGSGSIDPKSFTLLPGESRRARVSFNPHAVPAQTKRATVSVRAVDGSTLATLERELTTTSETDCNIALAWQRPILENDEAAGFVLSCSVKNVGPSRARFDLQFAKHPALRFDRPDSVTLDPNATADVPASIRWNQSERDMIGKNHPDAIEVFTDTSKGRRTSRLPWQVIDEQYQRLPKKSNGAAEAAPVAPVPTSAQHDEQAAKPYRMATTTLLPPPKTMQSLSGAPLPTPPKEPWMQRLPEPPPPVSPLASAITVVTDDDRRTTAARPHPKRDPAVRYSTLILSAIGVIALVVAIVLFFRPAPPAPAITSITQITPLPAAQVSLPPIQPSAATRKHPVKSKIGAGAGAIAGAAATAQSIGATFAPATPESAAAATPAQVASRPFTYVGGANTNEPVSLYNVDGSLEQSGRAVLVTWESSGQVSAQIQLTNARGRLIGQRRVRGDAQSTLLPLPRGYRGPVFIQLVAVGHQGDRVTESTQIGGF